MSIAQNTNPDFELAVQYVFHTDKTVFLTGKAGTGKTTFLRYVRAHCPKKMAVVAPTGVAAINAGGVTIHSLFQLPFGSYVADYPVEWGLNQEINNFRTLTSGLRLNNIKRQLIQELELLIVDEVSMLRSDLLDAIDAVLRWVRGKEHLPFGGVQLLFIGDLYQLPPVVSREEWAVLSPYYTSPFFFDARVFATHPMLHLELRTIYRQQDEEFIELLNNIRNNCADEQDMRLLEEHYHPNFSPNTADGYILLTTHNAKADVVNRQELEKLATPIHYFEATVKGDFNERVYPVDKRMALRVGAQVMFVKNDKGENRRYYNGKIATITRIEPDKIFVALDEHTELELEQETWRNVNFSYNKEKDEIEEEELGSFVQYPIRLAWAITIHKSQGLTFEKAIVDAGASFAPGQVYVALSRLTSLDGLVLHTRINPAQVMTDERVVQYASTHKSNEALSDLLAEEQKRFAAKKLIESFDLAKLADAYQEHYLSFSKSNIPEKEEALNLALQWQKKWTELDLVSQKFGQQLQQIFYQKASPDYTLLQERTKAAGAYFLPQLLQMEKALTQHIDQYKIKQKTKKYSAQLKHLQQLLGHKRINIEQAVQLANGMQKGLDVASLLSIVAKEKKEQYQQADIKHEEQLPAQQKTVGNSKLLSFTMYREGHSIESIAAARAMAKSTIEGHLISFISSGELAVSELVSPNHLSLILEKIKELNAATASVLKEQLPPEITYSDIRAVLAYHQRISELG